MRTGGSANDAFQKKLYACLSASAFLKCQKDALSPRQLPNAKIWSTMPHLSRVPLLIGASLAALFAQPAKRPLTLDDIAKIRELRDPQCSPDGQWVAYSVGTIDVKEDKHDSDIWMVSYDGKTDLRVTSSPESEGTPRWSPDGRYFRFFPAAPAKRAAIRCGCSTAAAAKPCS